MLKASIFLRLQASLCINWLISRLLKVPGIRLSGMNAQEIQGWVDAAQAAFKSAKDLDDLKNARLLHSGDKSSIAGASRNLGSLAPEEKASYGKIIGDAKNAIAQALTEATQRLENERDQRMLAEEIVDITLPVRRAHRGGLHPISIIKNDIADFFIEQGYFVEEGPEL